MSSSVPSDWPAEVPPPGSDGFADRAVDYLLDKVPSGYHSYDIFRRWPATLASLAHYHAQAVVEEHRQGYRTVRTELAGVLPPHAVTEVLDVYRVEGERHAVTARQVDMVARELFHVPPARPAA